MPAALTSARSAIQGLGGFIGASQQYRDGDDVVATITYRIPADRWEDALDKLRALGTEVGEQTDSADVTGQLVDLDARIRNLKASETALVGHLAHGDAGRRRARDRVATVGRPRPDRAAHGPEGQPRGPGRVRDADGDLRGRGPGRRRPRPRAGTRSSEVDQAGASLVGFLQALATAGIWFGIVWLPILAVLGGVIAIAVVVGRRFGLFRRSSPPSVPPPATAAS